SGFPTTPDVVQLSQDQITLTPLELGSTGST
ncbi:unnamed protein product, partial [marine sediment metagenome]